ncbi:MAG TPA: twitch domain-containing radical SAM protein [Pseudobdellovibrionaceae bacterium]|nr:twitch domain-containing radical SAM protein [Pseudobdellovibrionaceae bacterium]
MKIGQIVTMSDRRLLSSLKDSWSRFLAWRRAKWSERHLRRLQITPSFCPKPWLHAHVDAQGARRLCCIDIARLPTSLAECSKPLDEYWNSEELRDVRRRMLRGEDLERCRNCRSNEKNRQRSERDLALLEFRDWIPQILAQTRDDGHTTLRPIDFDYRSAICNFRCRICTPRSSSALQAEHAAHPEIAEALGPWAAMPAKERREAESRMDVHREKEIRLAFERGDLRKIYWAGGEPLLDPIHAKVMQELSSSPAASRVALTYNTNLSRLQAGDWNWLESLKSFRRVHLFVSVDGLGEVGQYLRTGFRDEVFRAHFRELQKWRKGQKRQVTLDLTLNLLNLFHLEPMMDFALQERVELDAKLMIESLANSYLMLELLPRSIKDEAVRQALAAIDRRGQPFELNRLRHTLNLALERPSLEESLTPTEYADYSRRAHRQRLAFEKVRPSPQTLQSLLPPEVWLALPLASPDLAFKDYKPKGPAV